MASYGLFDEEKMKQLRSVPPGVPAYLRDAEQNYRNDLLNRTRMESKFGTPGNTIQENNAVRQNATNFLGVLEGRNPTPMQAFTEQQATARAEPFFGFLGKQAEAQGSVGQAAFNYMGQGVTARENARGQIGAANANAAGSIGSAAATAQGQIGAARENARGEVDAANATGRYNVLAEKYKQMSESDKTGKWVTDLAANFFDQTTKMFDFDGFSATLTALNQMNVQQQGGEDKNRNGVPDDQESLYQNALLAEQMYDGKEATLTGEQLARLNKARNFRKEYEKTYRESLGFK